MVVLKEEYSKDESNTGDTWGTPEACCVLLSDTLTFVDMDTLHDGGTYGQGNTTTDLVRGIDLQARLS